MSGSKIDFSKELYVHNVSFSTTAETVRKYFSQYGPVFECRKVRDHNQCEGSALLTFVHAADAARALKRRRHFIDNRAVEVRLTPKGRTLARSCRNVDLDKQKVLLKGVDAKDVERFTALLCRMSENLNDTRSRGNGG